ncbi:AI-2E family transporter [uncultured Dokdonia sp.]|uniref:AI-2E family transporter n=1 Tax=uncultured Dokdonia sp. TaxID=575653 RepID=UPI0026309514|nr:AI-2E family transporter [uncultured Dokdonia sp.]
MKSNTITYGILRAIGILAGIALVLYFLYTIRSVLVYITIASVISLIGRPIIRFLRRRLKFKNGLAVAVTMVIIFSLLFGIMAMFIPLIAEQGRNLSLLNLDSLKDDLSSLFNQVNTYFSDRNIDLFKTLESMDLGSTFSFGAIPNLLNSVLGALGSISIGLFSVIFITFFLLKDSALLHQGVMTFVKDQNEFRATQSFNKIKDLLSRYFLGLLLQILVLFILYTIILLVFNIQNAIVIAFLCALLNLIPYVGPLVAGVIMMVLSMSSNLGYDFQLVILPTTIKVMVCYLFAQLIDNFISQPFIFSNSVKSHPLEIFLIIIIAGLLFGVVGMIVAIPVYTALKVIAKEFTPDIKIVKKLTKDL